MGYRVPRRTARLIFEDSDYEGAEVTCAFDVPLSVFLDFQRLQDAQNADQLEVAFRRFGDEILTEWNLEDDDGPVPATGDGLLAQPVAFSTLLLGKWVEAVAAAPLVPASTASDGDTSGAAPTETAAP